MEYGILRSVSHIIEERFIIFMTRFGVIMLPPHMRIQSRSGLRRGRGGGIPPSKKKSNLFNSHGKASEIGLGTPPPLSLSLLSLLKKFLDPRIIKSLCVHLKRHLVHCPIAIIPIFINVLYKISSKILCEAEEQIIIIVHI